MILLVLILLTIISGIVHFIMKRRGRYDNSAYENTYMTLLMVSIVAIVVSPFVYFSNLDTSIKLETFYSSNRYLYADTVDSTKALLSNDKLVEYLIEGNIEKIGLGESISSRIAEYRDAITQYNTSLASYKKLSSIVWISLFYPKISDDTKLIVFTD